MRIIILQDFSVFFFFLHFPLSISSSHIIHVSVKFVTRTAHTVYVSGDAYETSNKPIARKHTNPTIRLQPVNICMNIEQATAVSLLLVNVFIELRYPCDCMWKKKIERRDIISCSCSYGRCRKKNGKKTKTEEKKYQRHKWMRCGI